MAIREVLRGKYDCACKRDLLCDIYYVEIGNNILEKLLEICVPFSHILLVADGNTYPLCEDRIKTVLGEKIASEICIGDRQGQVLKETEEKPYV